MNTTPQFFKPTDEYEYTEDWFSRHTPVWNALLADRKPQKILEIGSFEGLSLIYMIENATKHHDAVEIHCVDSWQGGIEHANVDFQAVESRFWKNMAVARSKVPHKIVNVHVHKGLSAVELSRLVVEGHSGTFDWIFVDGSHVAEDVFVDAALAYQLAKPHGFIIFDDYNVPTMLDMERHLYPKPAIDAFLDGLYPFVDVIPMTNPEFGVYRKDKLYQVYTYKVKKNKE